MNRWSVFGAGVVGGIFALFALWHVEVLDSRSARGVAAFVLFGFYCAIVIFGTAGEKRSLSLFAQTVLGVIVACAIAAIFNASSQGYFFAAMSGLVLGFTADWWAQHVRL